MGGGYTCGGYTCGGYTCGYVGGGGGYPNVDIFGV